MQVEVPAQMCRDLPCTLQVGVGVQLRIWRVKRFIPRVRAKLLPQTLYRPQHFCRKAKAKTKLSRTLQTQPLPDHTLGASVDLKACATRLQTLDSFNVALYETAHSQPQTMQTLWRLLILLVPAPYPLQTTLITTYSWETRPRNLSHTSTGLQWDPLLELLQQNTIHNMATLLNLLAMAIMMRTCQTTHKSLRGNDATQAGASSCEVDVAVTSLEAVVPIKDMTLWSWMLVWTSLRILGGVRGHTREKVRDLSLLQFVICYESSLPCLAEVVSCARAGHDTFRLVA